MRRCNEKDFNRIGKKVGEDENDEAELNFFPIVNTNFVDLQKLTGQLSCFDQDVQIQGDPDQQI